MQSTSSYITKLVAWTKRKGRIHLNTKIVFFHRREIWWAHLGVNIGFEQDGKNNKFERPVLIVRRFGGNLLWALPLTTKVKNNQYYYQLKFRGKNNAVILSQFKCLSSKRLIRKIGTIPLKDFNNIVSELKKFL